MTTPPNRIHEGVQIVIGLFALAFAIGTIVFLAVLLTPVATDLILLIPQLLTQFGELFAETFRKTWLHWLVFPLVLAVVGRPLWRWLAAVFRTDPAHSRPNCANRRSGTSRGKGTPGRTEVEEA
jgi:H+/Cl- antiporter ClcA